MPSPRFVTPVPPSSAPRPNSATPNPRVVSADVPSRIPLVTNGIRLGTSALTSRGFGVAEMDRVAELVDTVLTKRDDATVARIKKEVRELADAFPLYAATKKKVGVG